MTPKKEARLDYDGLPEADLVDLAQAGSREAFRAIMQRCNQHLFRVARALVQNDAEAEDVVQEAYLRAFAGLKGFRAEASILTWLTRITLNEARARLRSRRHTVEVNEIEAMQSQGRQVIPFPSTEEAETPEATAARLQMRHLIEQAVDDLPPDFRVVFIMRDVEGCSIQETAEFLDILPETVKTRLHRARRLLRAALDEKIGAGLSGAFPFLGARCERMTDIVLNRLGAFAATCPAAPFAPDD